MTKPVTTPHRVQRKRTKGWRMPIDIRTRCGIFHPCHMLILLKPKDTIVFTKELILNGGDVLLAIALMIANLTTVLIKFTCSDIRKSLRLWQRISGNGGKPIHLMQDRPRNKGEHTEKENTRQLEPPSLIDLAVSALTVITTICGCFRSITNMVVEEKSELNTDGNIQNIFLRCLPDKSAKTIKFFVQTVTL